MAETGMEMLYKNKNDAVRRALIYTLSNSLQNIESALGIESSRARTTRSQQELLLLLPTRDAS